MPTEVTDPALLSQLNSTEVTDPALLAKLNSTGAISDFGKGTMYGATQGLGNILSAYGQGAQLEMSQPVDVPSGKETFDILQKNVTGELQPGAGSAGSWGRGFGGILPYMATMPSGASVPRQIGQALITSGGAELGKTAAEGTPYEGAAELAGGLAAPSVVQKGLGIAGKALSESSGMLTGTGSKAIETGFKTGMEGGAQGQAFRENMRAQVPPEKVISDAQTAMSNLAQARSADYQASMSGLSNDKHLLKFDDIDKAMQEGAAVKTFQGVSISPTTQALRDHLQKTVDFWKGAAQENPLFQTATGMDALKQRIGDIKDHYQYGTPEWHVADQVYNSIRKTITNQSPEYGAAMEKYAAASDELKQIGKTFSLGPETNADTALRKLQSVMRNNVNTNYGQRGKLADTLEQNGAPTLNASLAGQQMQSWTPRGMARFSDPVMLAALLGHVAMGNPASLGVLAAAPATSPRIVGEASHLAGRLYQGMNLPELTTPMNKARAAYLLSGAARNGQ